MVFLASLPAIAITAIAHFLLPFLPYFLKKGEKPSKESILKRLPALGISIGVTLLFALIILLAYGGYSFWNLFAFLLLVALALDFIDPIKTIRKLIKTENFRDRHLIFSSVIVVYILLEAFAFNARAYKSNRNTETISDFATSSLVTQCSYVTENEDGSITLLRGGRSYFEIVIPEESLADNIYFDYDATYSTEITVNVQYYDGSSLTTYSSFKTNPKTPEYNLIRIPRYEGVTKYRFTFTLDTGRINSPANIILKSFSLDAPVTFSFSIFRSIAVIGLSFTIIYFGYFMKGVKEKDFSRKPYIVLLSGGGIALLIVFIISWCNPDQFYQSWSYVQENASRPYTLDIYSELFEALQNGRFSLSTPVSDALREAEEAGINVYDRAWRDNNGISAVWDHAYYQGNYYSYYGIFPLFAVMYPIFWLSGGNYLPTHLLSNMIGLVILIPCFIILILEIYRLISKRIHYPTFIMLALLSVFLAMSFNNVTFKNGSFFEGIYHMPITYGLLNMDLFLIFLLLAYRKKEKRMLLLSFTGLFFVFLIMSRPSLVWVLLMAAPFYIKMLIDKEIPIKKRLLSFVPMIVILATGGAWVCYYNYARFGSIFEFGQSYQINYDQTHLTYGLDKIFPTIIHFYFQGPVFYDSFPFITCSVMRLSFDNVPYNQGYYGMFLIPFFLLSLVGPFMLKKKDKVAFFFSLAIPVAIFLLSFTCYSKAGICARYLIEPYHLSTLGGVIGAILLLKRSKEKEPDSLVAPGVIYGVALVSAFLCLNLALDQFDGLNTGDMDGIFLRLKEVFGFYNY